MATAAKKTEEQVTNTSEKASEIAKKIWLAGLGAYGKAFDGASEQMDKLNETYEKVSKETTELFDDLVSKGLKLDKENSEKLSDAKSKTATSIEERISKVRSSFNVSLPGAGSSISELSDKVDALTEKVDAILDQMTPKKTTKSKAKSA